MNTEVYNTTKSSSRHDADLGRTKNLLRMFLDPLIGVSTYRHTVLALRTTIPVARDAFPAELFGDGLVLIEKMLYE